MSRNSVQQYDSMSRDLCLNTLFDHQQIQNLQTDVLIVIPKLFKELSLNEHREGHPRSCLDVRSVITILIRLPLLLSKTIPRTRHLFSFTMFMVIQLIHQLNGEEQINNQQTRSYHV